MQIILSDFMSLDGVVQAPGGREEDTDGGFAHGGWSMPYFDYEAMGPAIDEVLATTDALLFGRRTWQTMAAAWPGRAGDPFADRMNEIRKYVASRTLTQGDLTWSGSTLLPADDAIGAVRELRAREGRGCRSWAAPGSPRGLAARGPADEVEPRERVLTHGAGGRPLHATLAGRVRKEDDPLVRPHRLNCCRRDASGPEPARDDELVLLALRVANAAEATAARVDDGEAHAAVDPVRVYGAAALEHDRKGLSVRLCRHASALRAPRRSSCRSR